MSFLCSLGSAKHANPLADLCVFCCPDAAGGRSPRGGSLALEGVSQAGLCLVKRLASLPRATSRLR